MHEKMLSITTVGMKIYGQEAKILQVMLSKTYSLTTFQIVKLLKGTCIYTLSLPLTYPRYKFQEKRRTKPVCVLKKITRGYRKKGQIVHTYSTAIEKKER